MPTLFSLLKSGEETLCHICGQEAIVESEILLKHTFSLSKTQLLVSLHESIRSKQLQSIFLKRILQRASGIPLAYVLGNTYFLSAFYEIHRGVFIPRFETESLVQEMVRIFEQRTAPHSPVAVVEVGFGSGVISIELAKRYPGFQFWGWDISKRAYQNACQNMRLHKVNNVSFIRQDFFKDASTWKTIFSAEKEIYLISNPPYIPINDIPLLDISVKKFEPKRALDGGKAGLRFYSRLLKLFCKTPLLMCFEIGINQKQLLERMLKKYGYCHYYFQQDIQSIPRILVVDNRFSEKV